MSIDPSRILYQDDVLLAVAKRSGELAVAGKGEMGALPLYDFHRKDFPGIRPIHRLDFETSGVMLFAKTKEVLEDILEHKFDQWRKTYRTLVAGRIRENGGSIDVPLPARDSRSKGKIPAHTAFRVLYRFPACTYVEATIEKGRHHQIRRHFQAIHHPLVLDDLYGDKAFNRSFGRQLHFRKFFLHAFSVDFPHPVTGVLTHIEAPLPKAFQEMLERLRQS